MQRFTRSGTVAASAEDVTAWFGSAGRRAVPPWADADVPRVRGFSFKTFEHTQAITPGEGVGCTIRDDVEFAFGPLGQVCAAGAVHHELVRWFEFRVRRAADDLSRVADKVPMRIAVSGSSGLVGGALCEFLGAAKNDVVRLVRRERGSEDEVLWNTANNRFDYDRLNADAVVHLAGEPIAGRWTDGKKVAIRQSRIAGTRLLCEGLAKARHKPKVLVSASAIGWYGNRGDEVCSEYSDRGSGFLADVAADWEAATQPAIDAGIRVVNLRIGLVVGRRGGILMAMLPAFKAGMGGPMGTGNQFMSWIALDDLVGAIHHCIYDESVSGPVNGTAPEPVSQRDFAHCLARILVRPGFVAVPGLAISLILGEAGQALILDGQCVVPEALGHAGYVFRYPKLEHALRFELGRELQ